MKYILVIAFVFMTVLVVSQPILSENVHQEDECPTVIQAAIDATDLICEGTGRNKVCYGHIQLEAQPQPGISGFTFNEPGHLADVAEVQSLHLSPLEVEEDIWGIALMKLQANIPASQLEDITLLVFGDVMLENAVAIPTSTETSVTADTYINVRRIPNTNGEIIGTLAPGQSVKALERLADQTWLRVELENGVVGWVLASLLAPAESPEVLNVSDGRTPYYRPMQAFYFERSRGQRMSAAADRRTAHSNSRRRRRNYPVGERN
jgi:uncharacterized protein YraI